MATTVDKFEPEDHITPDDYLKDLIAAASDTTSHFCKLDDLYSRLVDCVLVRSQEAADEDERLAAAAVNLLSRLPDLPVEYSLPGIGPGRLAALSAAYFSARLPMSTPAEWSNLVVASTFNINIIRLALVMSQGRKHVPSLRNLRRLGDTTADLLEAMTKMQREDTNAQHRDACFIVQACLWSSWQRFTMLFFWCVQCCRPRAMVLIYLQVISLRKVSNNLAQASLP